jgi:hypothetical protein
VRAASTISPEVRVDLDSLAKLSDLVGGIVLIISLIYLAYQVRQNTQSQRSENYARVLDRMSAVQSQLATDTELHHVFMVGAEDPARLTRAERLRFSWALYELFGAGEFMFHQARDNALPPAVWARWEAVISWWLSHPGMRAWWAAKPAPLTADFEAFGEQVLRGKPYDPAAIERWHRFVAGEGLPPPRMPVPASKGGSSDGE